LIGWVEDREEEREKDVNAKDAKEEQSKERKEGNF
jgi:hypothetical protein